MKKKKQWEREWFDADCPLCQQLMDSPDGEWVTFAEGLDDDSNSVLELIHAGELDEAETGARELLENYPDQMDGLELLARVYEARGNRSQAIQYYEAAIAFTHTREGFDEEIREMLRERIAELKPSLA